MREPAFWWRGGASWQSRLLAPLGALYGAVSGRRMQRPGRCAPGPVICVGNYHVGGAGKTPTAIALVRLLRQMGETPFVLSRGYGGTARGPVRVDPAAHLAAEVGDEPLLLAAHAPVIVARDRIAGADLAFAAGASVVVMDDGLQNPSLIKDFALVVMDGGRGTGNGAVFPAGPLRAPLAVQLPRTDALLIIGKGEAGGIAARVEAPLLRARILPDAAHVARLAGRPVLAFAGIGDPMRFFATLRQAGVAVAAERIFPDHHPFTPREIEALRAEARAKRLTLLTTEKDYVRLGPQAQASEPPIAAFPVTLEIADEDRLAELVATALARRRARG